MTEPDKRKCATPRCSEPPNGQGTWCCAMCKTGYGSHSRLCRRRRLLRKSGGVS